MSACLVSSEGDDARLAADLREVFGDPVFDEFEVDKGELRDLVTHAPQASLAVLSLYRAFRDARERAGASRGACGSFQRNLRHFQRNFERTF